MIIRSCTVQSLERTMARPLHHEFPGPPYHLTDWTPIRHSVTARRLVSCIHYGRLSTALYLLQDSTGDAPSLPCCRLPYLSYPAPSGRTTTMV